MNSKIIDYLTQSKTINYNLNIDDKPINDLTNIIGHWNSNQC